LVEILRAVHRAARLMESAGLLTMPRSVPAELGPECQGGAPLHPGYAAARVGDALARRLSQRVLDRSFMDELASLAGADPVEFRLSHPDDPRAREVISKAGGWGGRSLALTAGRSSIRMA
jgi:hypothetical protein